ncbi:MAG: FkbM family methyltransferase [Lachnospiraceae bacterium]|nr:FkbM family methyltransferase [Butyrivibrio sp.]MCM1343408.1 FkbM family methyltransferase [Muribaculaceae bacterium]MCM1410577.1 FkbM family methyltransferase [Lachnospiraceae bacterium]
MDIEGAEMEALTGACKTIQKNRPKLAICIYHKYEDLYRIPMYVKSLVPEYRIYIRHYSDTPSETVMYAII